MPYLIYLKGHYDDWPTNLAICNYIDETRATVKKLNEVAEKFLIDNAEVIDRINNSKRSEQSSRNEKDWDEIYTNFKKIDWPIEIDKELHYFCFFDDLYHGKPTIRGFDFVKLQDV